MIRADRPTTSHSSTAGLIFVKLATALLGAAALIALAGCEADAGGAAAVTWPQEIQLAVDQGVVFTVGDVVPSASYLKVDLIVRKHGSNNFDLKAGGSSASDTMYMNTFKSGGVRKIFASFDDVPSTLPTAANYGEYVNTVKTGNGLVLANNIGDGYTRIWVKQVIASAGLVVLQYQPVAL